MNEPLLPVIYPPLDEDRSEQINGRQRGVQGQRNSCYLDATLFSMFSFSSVFDGILIPDAQEREDSDGELITDIKSILRDGVVNPLRKNFFAPSEHVMILRQKMLHLDSKLTTEEMDPQEYLQLLFHDVLHLEEFISLSSGTSDYFHQVLVDPSPSVSTTTVTTIQQLFEKSLTMQKLKFKKIPSPALILQMPRSGNQYKMFGGILPNLTIDITDLMEDTPRACIICGTLATMECRDCFGTFPPLPKPNRKEEVSGADSTGFCANCSTAVHNREDRRAHKEQIEKISYHSFNPDNFVKSAANGGAANSTRSSSLSSGGIFSSFSGLTRSASIQRINPNTIPRVKMDLFAVICIETSHFVSFVKCGTERLAPWAFFDSMADRVEKIDGTGHNIPQVKLLPKMGTWLNNLEGETQEQIQQTMGTMTTELRRLLTDPYICFYYSPEASMYS